MLSKLSKASLGAGLMLSAVAVPVSADNTGFYGILSIGSINPSDQSYELLDQNNNSRAGKVQLGTETNYEAGIGYDWGKWRSDITFSKAKAPLTSCTETRTNTSCTKGGTHGQLSSIMASVYRDFPVTSKFSPFLGAGIGGTHVRPQEMIVNNTSTLKTLYHPRDQYGFSYQFKAGASYDILESLAAVADVTYRETSDIDVRTDVSKSNIKYSDISSTSFQFGLRYTF